MKIKSFIFGDSTSGIPILGYKFGTQGPKVLILGGVHGDEVEGVVAAHGLIEKFSQGFSLKIQLTIVPMFNVDGVLNKQRVNSRGVDLNRNMPTNDWVGDIQEPRYYPGEAAASEKETQHLIRHLNEETPRLIISLHSWKPLLNVNGDCRKEAEVINNITGYEIKEEIGYPTPGCLGTYSGLERDMPTLTYEIERGLNFPAILKTHVMAVHEALKASESRG